MMATTDERLAEIRAYLDYPEVRQDEAMFELGRLVPPVLDEYAAAMEIVRTVAAIREWLGGEMHYDAQVSLLTITKARALLEQEEAE